MPVDIIEALFEDWLWIAAAAFGIMTALVATVYAVGSMLMNEKVKTWAKMELLEIFYSAIILAVAITAIPTIDGVVQGALGVGGGGATETWIRDPGAGLDDEELVDICGDKIAADEFSVYRNIDACHIRLATYYLRSIFIEAKNFAYTVYRSYLFTSILAEFSINVETTFEQAGFFTWTPWRGFVTMGNTLKELSFDWATKLMMLTKFQELLVRFTATALFPALFVGGVILRTFAFTRRLGGLLMGMAIALYFIFPAFYAFGALVMLDLKDEARPAWLRNPANLDTFGNPRSNDPPIANTLYITGEIDMLGGSGKLSQDELESELEKFEEMDPEEYAEYVEDKDKGFTPDIDLTKDTSTMSEAERESAFEGAQEKMDDWFGSVSSQNMLDKLATKSLPGSPSYWGPNGHLDTLARITFFSLFFSLFGILGTIAAIRSLSITFGGDVEIAGLTRLI